MMLKPVSAAQLSIIQSAQLCAWLEVNANLKPADLERARRLLTELEDAQLPSLLTRLGLVSEFEMARAWGAMLQAPLILSDSAPQSINPLPRLTERFMRYFQVVPIEWLDEGLHVLAANPNELSAFEAIAYRCEMPVWLSVAPRDDIETLIERYYGEGRSAMTTLIEDLDKHDGSLEDVEHLKDLASEAPVIRLVNLILQRAVEQLASDIHIEPFESELKVRYRIDGVLNEAESPPSSSSAAVISRIKIMARLNIAERRLPQDGRIMLRVQGKELDLRVSTVPTSFGESVVMRLLDRQSINFDFQSLGFDGKRLDTFIDLLNRQHGILLVTGPTGSGKTTTLYTALSRLNTTERKVITVEDPVEYQLQGINQIQVKPAIGLDFAGALRSILRQDPDVIMIGEMRDLETSRIAIQSSLTGHLVLSTLHTNSAAAGITRLLEMGIEGYLVASTINGILAQRLVRRLAPETREAFEASQELIDQHELYKYTDKRPILLYRPCSDALGGGYRGRVAIYELLVMNEELRRLLMRCADAATLEQAARRAGLRTLHEEGLRQALSGMTSLEEVLRVTRGD